MSHTIDTPTGYRKRRHSRRIFCYVLNQFLLTLVACLGAFLVLFLVGSLIDDLGDFVKHDAGVGQIVQYFLLLQPGHLVNVVPMALLMASMYVVSSLCRTNELTAFRASGVSIFQVTLPIWMIAVGCGLVNFLTTEYFAPRAQRKAEQLRHFIADPYHKRPSKTKSYLAFRNREGFRDWFFESFSVHGVCRSISITQFRPDRSVSWELTAEEGWRTETGWEFKNAVQRRFDEDGYLPIDQPMESAKLIIPELYEDPESFAFLFRLRPMEEMSATAVLAALRRKGELLSPNTKAILQTYLSFYLFSPLTCLIGVILGVPLAVTHQRGTVVGNFVLAVAVMATYHLLAEFFVVLGKNQYISPLVAGTLPTLILIGIGAWKMRKLA